MNKKYVIYSAHSVIFVLHILLLVWIFYVLRNGGNFPIEKSLLHFLGMSLFGAFLIKGSASTIKKLTDKNYYSQDNGNN